MFDGIANVVGVLIAVGGSLLSPLVGIVWGGLIFYWMFIGD